MSEAIALPAPNTLAAMTHLERVYFGYLADYSGPTRVVYEYHLRRFLSFCDRIRVQALEADRTHLALYVRHLIDSGLRASTVNGSMTPVKGFYKWALLEGFINRDPVVHTKLPKVDYRQKYPLDRQELREIRAAAKELGGRHWALGELLIAHALRITEATSVRIENYQETERGHRVLRLRRKGGAFVTLPLPIAIQLALDDAAGGRTSGPVIVTRDGRPIGRGGATGLVNTIVRHTRIDKPVNPHLIRASVITVLLDAGGDIREAQYLAGHLDPRTTSRHYDLSKRNHDLHPVHINSARLTV